MKKMVLASLSLLFFSTLTWYLSESRVSGFYADIVLNSKAEQRGMPPVAFPHWLHRLGFHGKACGVREVSLGTARDDDRSTARCAVMTPGDRFRSVIKAGGGVFK